MSETRSSFLPARHPHGDERFGIVNEKAERNNGFTRFIQPTADMTGNQYTVSYFWQHTKSTLVIRVLKY